MRDLATLSWRHFLVLLHGLGPQSIVASTLQAREYARTHDPQGRRYDMIDDPVEAERRVWNLFQ